MVAFGTSAEYGKDLSNHNELNTLRANFSCSGASHAWVDIVHSVTFVNYCLAKTKPYNAAKNYGPKGILRGTLG